MITKLKDINSTEDGLLSKLYRQIIFDTGKINTLKYDINKYIKNGGAKVKSSVLSSVIASEMTWKNFIFLLFEIHKFKKIKFTITITHDSGIETEHSLVATPKDKSKTKDEESS